MRLVPLLVAGLGLAGSLFAQVVVLPPGFANTEGNDSSQYPFGRGNNGCRAQYILDTAALIAGGMTGPSRIDTLTWRANGGAMQAGGTYAAGTVTLRLGVCGVDHLAASTMYDNNVVSSTSWVLGSVVVANANGAAPNNETVTIAVPGGYVFDPTAGQDLVIEVRYGGSAYTPSGGSGGGGGGGGGMAAALDAHLAPGIGGSRLLSGMQSATTATVQANVLPALRLGCTPLVVAANTGYGVGCGVSRASIYQQFLSSTAALSNTALRLTRTANGYDVGAVATSLVPPSIGATTLALVDDDEASVALSMPFPHATGTTTSLQVCSNGIVSVGPGNGAPYGGYPGVLLDAPVTAFWSWHDYDPGTAGSGAVTFEEVAGVAYVTWNGVWGWGETSAAGGSTMQFQFELATGDVTMVFGSMAAVVDGHLVGYSPGGVSLDPGATDFATQLPKSLSLVDRAALSLTSTTRPIVGTTVHYTIGSIPANAFASGHMMTLGGVDAGVDLGFLGMVGCHLYVDIGNAVTTLLLGAPTAVHTFAVPNDLTLLGLVLDNQALALVPGSNPLGIVVSNAIASTIGVL